MHEFSFRFRCHTCIVWTSLKSCTIVSIADFGYVFQSYFFNEEKNVSINQVNYSNTPTLLLHILAIILLHQFITLLILISD